MKFNIMSDLHLEFGDLYNLPGGEILLIAGDLGLAKDPYTYIPFLDRESKKYDKIFFVMGNHEHYHGDFSTSYEKIQEAIEDIPNVYCLENEAIVLDKETILIGATLWSDIDPIHEAEISSSMNDYHIIVNSKKRLTTSDTKAEHYNSVKYLERIMKENKDRNIIVMTHHSPTLKTAEAYRGNSLNSAYGTDLNWLLHKYKPKYWIHGHTHVSMQYRACETDIIVNPRGYNNYDVNPEFDVNLIMEV